MKLDRQNPNAYQAFYKRATKKIESSLAFTTQKMNLQKAGINYVSKGGDLYVTPEDYEDAVDVTTRQRRRD